MEFIRSNPLGYLVMIRIIMEPCRQYMDMQFRLAGDKWEQEQRVSVLKALQSGLPARRLYRPQVLASGVHDRLFLDRSMLMMKEKDLWSVMVPSMQTFEMRCLAFQAASRMMCSFVRLQKSRHEAFPLQMFNLLRNPERAAEYTALSECLLDDWSLGLKKQFPTLSGSEFSQVLYTTAMLLAVDTTHIEALHSSIRRHLFAKSVHTHKLDLQSLSAQWVLQQHRTTSGSPTSVRKVLQRRRGAGRRPKEGVTRHQETPHQERIWWHMESIRSPADNRAEVPVDEHDVARCKVPPS